MSVLTAVLLFLLATGVVLTAVTFGTRLILVKCGLATKSPAVLARNADFLKAFFAMLGLVAVVFSSHVLLATHAVSASLVVPIFALAACLVVFVLVSNRPTGAPAQRVRSRWALATLATIVVLLYVFAEFHNQSLGHLHP